MIELRIAADTPDQMASMLSILSPGAKILSHVEKLDVAKDEIATNDQDEEKIAAKAEEDSSIQPEETTNEVVFSIDDIRAALAKVNEAHGLLKAKELMGRFGVSRVSDLSKEQYGAFLTAAGEMAG